MENKIYRTAEQFREILDSCINGNYSQAKKECELFNFNLQDLKNSLEEYHNEMGMSFPYNGEEMYENLDMLTSIF